MSPMLPTRRISQTYFVWMALCSTSLAGSWPSVSKSFWSSIEAKLESLLLEPSLMASTKNKQIVIWMLWRLWKSRNNLIFRRKKIHWRSLVRYGIDDAMDYLNSQEITIGSQQRRNIGSSPIQRRQQRWKRPPQGWIKCNYDGSFHNRVDISKAGWIIRDDNGVYRGAG